MQSCKISKIKEIKVEKHIKLENKMFCNWEGIKAINYILGQDKITSNNFQIMNTREKET